MAKLNPKTCERCDRTYTPTGPAQRVCADCWGYKTCECGKEFLAADPVNRRKNKPGAKLCPECRSRKRGEPGTRRAREIGETFTCRDCKQEFPVSKSVKDASRKSGIMERCRECDYKRKKDYRDDPVTGPIQRERVREAMAKPHMRAAQAKYIREKRWASIGATPEYYDAQFAEQGGRCDICGTDVPKRGEGQDEFFCIDHDHAKQGEDGLRGLLCVHCNLMIGHALDDPERLAKGIAYLGRWGIMGHRRSVGRAYLQRA